MAIQFFIQNVLFQFTAIKCPHHTQNIPHITDLSAAPLRAGWIMTLPFALV